MTSRHQKKKKLAILRSREESQEIVTKNLLEETTEAVETEEIKPEPKKIEKKASSTGKTRKVSKKEEQLT